MPNSPRYQLAKLIADALNALTRGIVQGAASIEFHIAEFHSYVEHRAQHFAILADQKAVAVAEDVHDKKIRAHHLAMQEANAIYEAAVRAANVAVRAAKTEREMMVNLAADGCDEVRQALRMARDWHDA